MKINFHSFLLLMSFLFTGCVAKQPNKAEILKKSPSTESYKKFDDTRKVTWGKNFQVVGIPSKVDTHIQKAYFYKSKSTKPRPLIVSLHTWSGDYQQRDQLAELSEAEDLNYIHPDFRGPNFTQDACCSQLALSDIDASITYAIENSKVDTTKIYVIGVSGGGYAALASFMKSKHRIKKFSAWASITSLVAWYNESRIRGNNYAANILACTGSKEGKLDKNLAQIKSPLYWTTPVHKLEDTSINIYSGIYDGIQGSVPITHSINFYNKLLSDLSVTDSSNYVSDREKLELLEFRKPLGDFGKISDREICLIKEYKNLKLVIFMGNHEMLTEFAFNELLVD